MLWNVPMYAKTSKAANKDDHFLRTPAQDDCLVASQYVWHWFYDSNYVCSVIDDMNDACRCGGRLHHTGDVLWTTSTTVFDWTTPENDDKLTSTFHNFLTLLVRCGCKTNPIARKFRLNWFPTSAVIQVVPERSALAVLVTLSAVRRSTLGRSWTIRVAIRSACALLACPDTSLLNKSVTLSTALCRCHARGKFSCCCSSCSVRY